MMHSLRSIVRSLAIAGLALAVILAGGILFVQTGYFKGWLLAQVLHAVGGGIEGSVRVERLNGTLFTGVTLSGIEIAAPGTTVISAAEVRVSYFLPALLTRTFDITRVTVSRPRLTFRQEREGAWNFQRAFAAKKKAARPPSTSPGPLEGWSFRVGKLEIAGASAVMTGRGGKTVLAVPAFSLSSRGTLKIANNRVEGTVDLDAFRAAAEEPVALPVAASGQMSFSPRGIQVDYLDIAAGNSRGRVAGTLAAGRASRIDARAEFPVVSFDDVRRIAPSVSLSSAAALSADFRGTTSSFTAAAVVSYGDLRIESSGTADLSRLRVAGTGRIRNLHPDEVLPGCVAAKRASCPPGDISADVAFDLDGNPFETGSGTCTVRLLPSRVGSISAAGGTLSLAARGGTAEVRAEGFATSAGTFSARGSAEIAGLARKGAAVRGGFLASGRHVDLAVITGTGTMRSDLNFDVNAALSRPAGDRRGIVLSGAFRASTSTVQDIAFTGIDADFTVAGGTVSVPSLSVLSEALTLSAGGTIAPRGVLAFSYALAVNDLGVLGRFVPAVSASGMVRSSGTVRGTMAHPSFSGVASGENLRYRGFAVKTFAADVHVSVGGNINRLPAGTVRLSAGDLSAGKTPVKGISVNAATDGSKASFNAGLQKDDARDLYLSGEADLHDRDRARVLLTDLEIRTGTVTWSNTRPVQAVLSPERVTVDSFDLAYSSQALSVSGGWEKGGAIRLDAAIRGLDLATAAGAAGIAVPLAGVMHSSFTVRGRAASPEINGTLFVSPGAIGGFPFDRIASTAVYSGGQTRLRFSLYGSGGAVLTASGTVPSGGGNMDLQLAARDLDLSVLSAIVPSVDQASGLLSAAVTVKGSAREPKINGRADLSGGTLGIRGTGVTYRDLQLLLRIDGDTLYVDRLSLRSDEGEAGLSGSVRLRGFVPESGSIDITARRFKAMDARVFSGLIDADLRLRPQGGGSLLGGTFTVLEGQVNIPRVVSRPGREITVIETGAGGKPRVVTEPARAAVPFVDRLALRVDASLPGNTWVRGSGVNAEVRGKVLVARNAGEPVTLSGDISTVQGTYQFRGKLLQIDQGTVSFTGERRIDPELNAQASTVIDNITIYVSLRGTAAQPRITLRSEPPRDESDLVAYLVFGRPLSKLNEAENRTVQRAAVQALGGLAATGIRDLLGQELAPDVINVYSGQESGFSVGKYITNRLFIRYEWRFGVEEVRQTLVNVQLNRRFSLSSQVGSEQTSGVDLIWTTNY